MLSNYKKRTRSISLAFKFYFKKINCIENKKSSSLCLGVIEAQNKKKKIGKMTFQLRFKKKS